MFTKVKSGSDEVFKCDIDKDVAAEIVRNVTSQNAFLLSLLGYEMPNAPVKWAAVTDPVSEQEQPAAPLERLVGQESEKTVQEGIGISHPPSGYLPRTDTKTFKWKPPSGDGYLTFEPWNEIRERSPIPKFSQKPWWQFWS